MDPGDEDVRVHFRWPADVWMRSFDLQLFDKDHRRLNQPTTMHHMELLDFDRRQVLYPMVERVDSASVKRPAARKSPSPSACQLFAGMDMGLYVMWNNHTDHGSRGRHPSSSRSRYSPLNLVPRPTDRPPVQGRREH